MRLHATGRMVLAAWTIASIACGGDVEGDCLEVCEASKKCTETAADCPSLCERVASDAEASECQDETNAYYACRLENDACSIEACDAELGDVTVCQLDFCLESPEHRLCDLGG
jgi:hypothetical protein